MAAPANALVALLLLCCLQCFADVYMHHPRGSNNRLDERSANRNNGNRMFDSQNNNRGGYNKGDKTDQPFGDTYSGQYDMFHYMSDASWKTNNKRSILGVEWTNQHGCGGNELGDPHKLNCEIILQYMCVPENSVFDATRDDCTKECFVPTAANPNCAVGTPTVPGCPAIEMNVTGCSAAGYIWADAQYFDQYNCPHRCEVNGAPISANSRTLCEQSSGTWVYHTGNTGPWLLYRDGVNTERQEYTQPQNEAQLSPITDFDRKDNNVVLERGLHESWEWYDGCYRRERNRGLFTADQNLQNNNLGYSSAIFTRQNPNNNRRGYECPEERDYYPYWHPSPWRDIVIMTDRLDLCPFYQSESQNVKGKDQCFNTANCNNCIRYNNRAACVANNGAWKRIPAFGIDAPECIQAPWSRVNHLGNGRHGQPNSYNWTLPFISSVSSNSPTGVNSPQRCVLRLRYNMSTDDYNAWMVNASFNNNDGQGIKSPVKQNPNVDIGASNQALRLAINTAQFGRTFQDRSHVFRLLPRPTGAQVRPSNRVGTPANIFSSCSTLYNLNVRGKRGNIVQTFPAVEYDFYPNQLHISTNDCVHIQWTGSNTHNNGNPAGDGQAGDAGEGRGGTDRHNFVEMGFEFAESFPLPYERFSMFSNITDAYDPLGVYDNMDNVCHCNACLSVATSLQAACYRKCWDSARQNWALRMATVGYYDNYDCPNFDNRLINTQRTQLNNQLDNAFASYAGGVFKFSRGTYNYMCTRNHNFSNRDQKGKLLVE